MSKGTSNSQEEVRTGEAPVPLNSSIPMCLLPRVWGVVILMMFGGGCANGHARKPTTRPAGGVERFEYVQVHMGVAARLVVYAKDEETAVEACTAAYRRVAELEQI